MGLELVGLRLLAPRFGASTYVWGGLLGAIMAALALGYLAGGALADRFPRPRWVFGLLFAGAVWVVVDLLVAEALLDGAERLGAVLGPIVSTAALLGPPMILLGSVSPFVVKLDGQIASLGFTAGRVFAGESPYNTVHVADEGGDRLLYLNDRREGSHSVRLGGGLLTGGYSDVLALGPHLAGGRRVLVLGMGGGTTVTAYRRLYPGAHVTAVEIDPLVVRVADEYLGLEHGPDLEIHVEDARPFLRRSGGLFDVIEVDVFAGGPYAPFYCLTAEFFEAGRALLVSPELPQGLQEVARGTAAALRVSAPGGAAVLTDDRAPVEQLTHRMIVQRRQ